MDDRLDIPYKSMHKESELDKKLRLYAEADELYEKLVKDIKDSRLDEFTKIICLFNIKTQWLERSLNDFYDRIAVTSSKSNPYVSSKEISNKYAKSFKKNGRTVGFENLTLGGKYKALKLFSYIDKVSEKNYQEYLVKLDNFIKERNQVIHNLFTQNIDRKKKIQTITEQLSELEELLVMTDERDNFLSKYLFDNMGEYWDLSIRDR